MKATGPISYQPLLDSMAGLKWRYAFLALIVTFVLMTFHETLFYAGSLKTTYSVSLWVFSSSSEDSDAMWTADNDDRQLIDYRILKLPDVRGDPCKKQRELNNTNAQKISIVMQFYNYEFYDLKMTLGSILYNTNSALIGEIIVVDDGSTLDYLVLLAQEYFSAMPVVKLLRNEQQLGLAKLRNRGFYEAQYDVIVYISPTVVCTKGWLEPLLDLIDQKPQTIAVPHFDNIEDLVSYSYSSTPLEHVPSLTTSLSIRLGKMAFSGFYDHVEVPVVRGDVFAVRKSVFASLGLYDINLSKDFAEHVELSLRISLCNGGSITMATCSRVGVININEVSKIISDSHAAYIANLWLDDKNKALVFQMRQMPSNFNSSSLKSSLLSAVGTNHRQCATFNNYVAKFGSATYVQRETNSNFGQLLNKNKKCACLGNDYSVEVMRCSTGLLVAENCLFELDDGKLVVDGLCLTAQVTNNILVQRCHPQDAKQKFNYTDGRFINVWTKSCLTQVTDPDNYSRQTVYVQSCIDEDDKFAQWEFVTLSQRNLFVAA